MESALNALMKNSPASKIGQGMAPPVPLLDRGYSGPSGHFHHEYSHKGGKNSIALSALTLLAFLFFLNILQNCIQDHIDDLQANQNQVIVMAARDDLVAADKRKGVNGKFVNSSLSPATTTTTTTTERYSENEQQLESYDQDIYFEEIEQVTSGPSKIFIQKKNNGHMHFH